LEPTTYRRVALQEQGWSQQPYRRVALQEQGWRALFHSIVLTISTVLNNIFKCKTSVEWPFKTTHGFNNGIVCVLVKTVLTHGVNPISCLLLPTM
jgi:hypothetical protein